MIVANTSPIINLGKQATLELLRTCFKKIIVPKSVYDEVNRRNASIEAAALEKAVNQGWIVVEHAIIDTLLHTENLGQGEKEAISLARKHNTAVLLDDDSARTYARVLGVEVHGTLYVLLLACQMRNISADRALGILHGMISNGFYISTDVYVRFQNMLGR